MKSIKEECLRYSLVCGIKSEFKDIEIENENLKEELRKFQKDCMVLNSRIVTINWKIQQAKFILEWEKKKQNLFYNIMQTAESRYAIKAEIALTEEKKRRNLCELEEECSKEFFSARTNEI